MKKTEIKLPAEVSAKYDLVSNVRQIIIQQPEKKKINLENCTLEDAKVLAQKGYLKEKSSTPSKGDK